jgi:hypothetical protein
MPPPVLLPAGTAPPIGISPNTFSATRPPALLARAIDPRTGEITSLFSAPHPVDAAIAFNARALSGSGPALEVGTRYHEIRDANDQAKGEYAAETRRWVKPFMDRGWIDILKVQAEILDDSGSAIGAAYVAYRNRLTGKEDRVDL